MDWQVGFNALIGVGLVVLGWMLRSLSESIRDLRKEDQALAEKVSELGKEMAVDYVHKSDLRELSAAIFKKLDRIEDKLDGKVDRHPV